jgi:F-type H+-transporting ATPase subunit delta
MIDSIDSEKPQADVGAQRVATVYAKAFLGAAVKSASADALVDEVMAVAGVLRQFPDLDKVFASALVSEEDKVALLDRLFASQVSTSTLDFLKVLARHGRLELVRVVAWKLQDLYNELRGRVRVEVHTAIPLEPSLSRGLEASLRQLLGGEPQLESAVRPELIGGVVLRVGDTVYDGSVARQLEQVREQMITRSVHEIQSRRDRLRHPGGN